MVCLVTLALCLILRYFAADAFFRQSCDALLVPSLVISHSSEPDTQESAAPLPASSAGHRVAVLRFVYRLYVGEFARRLQFYGFT